MKRYLAERKHVAVLAGLVMLLTLGPYLMGFAVEGQDWKFTGFVIGVEDGNSYLAKMLSGAAGDWLFRSPYSVERQRGALLFLPYLLLGKLTSPPGQHAQLAALFHGFRFGAGILAIFATYDFLAIFIPSGGKKRIWGLAAAVLGGGAGWVLVAAEQKNFLGSIPLDFLSPESFGFLGLLGFPHLALSRALLLWGFVFYLGRGDGVWAGLLWLLMGLFQPLAVLVAWVVVGLHVAAALIRDWIRLERIAWEPDGLAPGTLRTASISILISSPLVIYTAASFLTDPYLKAWTAQNTLPSPHWFHYLLAYGLVLPFSVVGTIKIFRNEPAKGSLLGVWLLVFPLLIQAPVGTQRRLAEGIWVVMVAGLMAAFQNQTSLKWFSRALIAALLPSSLILLAGAAAQASAPARPAFLPAAEVEAYRALRDMAAVDSVVLAEFRTGNNLPAWAPVQVVLGHGPETVHLPAWLDLVDSYLGDQRGNGVCQELLLDKGVDYLFWGPSEREEWPWDPGRASCLKIVYNQGGYQIYRVLDGSS